jgi:hypothetical protein
MEKLKCLQTGCALDATVTERFGETEIRTCAAQHRTGAIVETADQFRKRNEGKARFEMVIDGDEITSAHVKKKVRRARAVNE